jgi:hypothetical protein
MKREDILKQATECVIQDRNTTYGEPEDSFGLIAAYWSAHLDADVKPSDVAVMMTLLKLARIKGNAQHVDSWIDGAGYLACGGEIVSAAPAEPDRETAMVQAIIREWAQPDNQFQTHLANTVNIRPTNLKGTAYTDSMTYFDGAPV